MDAANFIVGKFYLVLQASTLLDCMIAHGPNLRPPCLILRLQQLLNSKRKDSEERRPGGGGETGKQPN